MAGVSQTPRKCRWHRPGIAPKAQGRGPEGTVPLTQLRGARQNQPALSLSAFHLVPGFSPREWRSPNFYWGLLHLPSESGLAKQSITALNLDWVRSPDNTIIIINSCQDPVRSDWGHWHIGWALGDWGTGAGFLRMS